jgi:hypothetical protein
MADALALGASVRGREGSSPSRRTQYLLESEPVRDRAPLLTAAHLLGVEIVSSALRQPPLPNW